MPTNQHDLWPLRRVTRGNPSGIKSPQLCQLSYGPKYIFFYIFRSVAVLIFLAFGSL